MSGRTTTEHMDPVVNWGRQGPLMSGYDAGVEPRARDWIGAAILATVLVALVVALYLIARGT